MTCYETIRAAAPCKECGVFDAPLHVIAEVSKDRRERHSGFYCKDHCPVHRQAAIDWQDEPKTIAGEQEEIPW